MAHRTNADKQRHILLGWAGIIVLILSVGFTACWQLWQQRFQQEWELGEILARQTSQSMRMWLNNQINIARTLADSPVMQQATTTPGNAADRANASDYLNRFHSQHPEFTLITIIPFFDSPESITVQGLDGQIQHVKTAHSLVDSVGGASVGTGGLSFNYIKSIYDGAPAFISEAKENAVKGFPSLFMIAVPIFDNDGHLSGALGIGIKLEYFSIFFSDQVRTGKTGSLDIIDDRGLYVSHSNRSCLLNPNSILATGPLLNNVRDGKTHFLREDEGVLWLYSMAPVKIDHTAATQWWVLFRQDRNEVIQELLWPLVGLAMLCLLVSGLLILLLLRANQAVERTRKAKEFLKQMEAYRLYTRSVPYGILLVDSSGKLVDINPSTTTLWGYSAEELLGQPLHRNASEMLQEPHWSGLTCTILELAQIGTLRDVAVRLRDGSTAAFDLSASYLQNGHNAGCYVVTIAPVPATRDLEERMEAVYRTSYDYYIIFGADAKVLDCTDSCVTLFEAASRQDVQDNFVHFSPEIQPNGRRSAVHDQELIKTALREGFYKTEWLHQTKSGELIPCEISLVRFTHQGRPAVTACLRDLREQKQHEAILARERTILRTVIDGMQNYLFLRDDEDRYLVVNRRFCEVMGVNAKDVLGKTSQDILNPAILELNAVVDRIVLDSEGPYIYEQVLTLPDGTQRDYLMSREAIRDETDGLIGILGVGVDVGRLKEAERQIVIAKNFADAASQAKSDFLARMSHEIRTPMNAILGMTYLCLRNEMPSSQRVQLQKIQNAAEHLMEILNSILDFSKIESGKMEVEFVSFSLYDLLDQVSSLFLYKAQASGVALNIDIAPDVPARLIGDPLHLRQILINLGSNALKFTHEGEICIQIMLTSVLENQVRLSFYVHDTGIGMSEDQLGQIFQPFTQANGSITRLYGGTGLGLAITKNLVDMLGGQISVNSAPGKGTTFHVSLWLGIAEESDPLEIDPALNQEHQILPSLPPLVDYTMSAAKHTAKISSAPTDSAAEPETTDLVTGPVAVVAAATVTPPISPISTILTPPTASAAPAQPPVTAAATDTQKDAVRALLSCPPEQWQASPCSVLLVEDDPINQEIAVELLCLSGIVPHLAANGKEAVAAHAAALNNNAPYDLILMDIQMPLMDGLEATRRIRRTESQLMAPHRPIVAMTAHAMISDRQHCMDAGMDDHLAKPIDPAKLRLCLQQWLEKR